MRGFANNAAAKSHAAIVAAAIAGTSVREMNDATSVTAIANAIANPANLAQSGILATKSVKAVITGPTASATFRKASTMLMSIGVIGTSTFCNSWPPAIVNAPHASSRLVMSFAVCS